MKLTQLTTTAATLLMTLVITQTVNANMLTCKQIKCIDVSGQSACSRDNDDLPFNVVSMQYTYLNDDNSSDINIDVNENGGDDINIYVFNRAKFENLKTGDKINGRYLEGFIYHVIEIEKVVKVSCIVE